MNFIATCTDDFGWRELFLDATEMAQCIETSKILNKDEFRNLTGKDFESHCTEFGLIENKGVAWAYDPTHDIHYFYN